MQNNWILLFVLVIILLHYCLKFVIYLLFGLTYKYINPFDLSIHNLCHDQTETSGVKVSILKLKMNLLFTTFNKDIGVALTDLVIDLMGFELDSNVNNIKDENSTAYDKIKTQSDYDELMENFFDPKLPITLNIKNRKIRKLTKWLISYIPKLTFQIKSTCLLINPDLSIVAENLLGKVDLQECKSMTAFSNIKNEKNFVCTSSIDIQSAYLCDQKSNKILSKFFDYCTISLKFELDTNSMGIFNFEPVVTFTGVDFSLVYFSKLMGPLHLKLQMKNENHLNTSSHSLNRKLYICGFVYRLMKHAKLNLQSFKISEIPVSKTEIINNSILTQDFSLDGTLFASLKIDSLSLNATPIYPTQVGFTLKFVEESFPIQWIMSLGNMKVSLDFTNMLDYTGTVKQLDILSISNLLIRIESTLLVNVLRILFGNIDLNSFKRKQTLTSIQFTLTNPVIDISVEQLISLMKVINEISKNHYEEKEEDVKMADKNQSYPLLKYFMSKVLLALPRFELNVLIEKPLLLLKSANDGKIDQDMHLLVAQSSLVNMICNAKTHHRSLLTNLKANIPDLTLSYQRNNNINTTDPVFTIRDMSFATSMQLISLKDFNSSLDIFRVEIDLTNIMALNGLSVIFNLIQLYSLKLRTPKKQYRQPISHKEENMDLLFKDLPSWFSSFTIKINLFKLKVGSKSIFIHVKDLLNEADDSNVYIEGRPYAPATSTFKLSTFSISVVKKSNMTNTDDDSTTIPQKTRHYDEFYWDMDVVVSKAEICTQKLDRNSGKEKSRRVLSIPVINTKIYWLRQNICEIRTEIETLTINHSVSSHFLLFSSVSLLSNAISYHKYRLFSDFDTSAPLNKQSNFELSGTKSSSRFTQLHFSWKIKEIQFKIALPEEMYLRLDMYHLIGDCKNNNIVMNKRLVRLSVKKDRDLAFYNRLLSIETLNLVIKLPSEQHEIAKVYVKDKSIRVSIPSNFVVHSLFEAITLTVKLTKKFLKTIQCGVSKSRDKIKPSGIIELPSIRLKSMSLAFVLEDDPFESELNMIYQLGLLEQKHRLEKQKQFDEIMKNVKREVLKMVSDDHSKKMIESYFKNLDTVFPTDKILATDNVVSATLRSCYRSLHKLRVNISKSWIQIVEEFKLKRKSIIERNKNFLSNEILFNNIVSSNFNSGLLDFNDLPPLMSILLDQVDIVIVPPVFSLDGGKVQNFINRVGKGVPLNTIWDKIVPMDISFKASEIRMHLKDYPLPMVYVPNSTDKNIKCFTLNAQLAIAERAPYSNKEYWYKFIPMFQSINEADDKHERYSFYAPKTVTSVKTYYEVNCSINTENPTVITWSMGYQPVLRQLNICFDTFSKQSIDPSPKLGVWDKLRNIVHGFVKINWVNQNSEVIINIPNSSDPYKLLLHSAGFSLILKHNVSWLINDPLRENERDYFIFKCNTLIFGVPDHLYRPLPCWCSNDLVFFGINNKGSLLTSMFGYYLNTDAYCFADAETDKNFDVFDDRKFKTRNIFLDGDIELKLSMTFQRLLDNGEITEQFKSHYENVLKCPEYVKTGENVDSYKGFRSDFIHMALNLKAHQSLNNILRVSPKSVFEFIKWFKLFSRDLSLPIRNGKLWGERTQSVDMGSHLQTFKFSFDVEPLFIYHGYRIDLAKPENKSVVALKARIGSFQCDLHERKEKMIEHVEFLDKSRNIMKMRFYIGKVDISELDLRVIGLKFNNAVDCDNPNHKFEIFDNDTSWISFQDFDELDMISIEDFDVTGQVLPVLYATKFIYWMNKELSENKFGNELSHDCHINAEEFPKRKFNHIFDVNQLKLKWYREVRNLIFEYVSELRYRAAYAFGTSYKARSEIMKKLQKPKVCSSPEMSKTVSKSNTNNNNEGMDFRLNIETAEDFANALRSSTYNFSKVVPVDDFLIRLKDIQIQIMVDSEADDLILFRTKYNEIEIVTLRNDGWYQQVKKIEHAQRFGTIFKDADLLAISKKEYIALGKDTKHYGTMQEWPPFLDGHEPEIFINSKTILSDILVYFIFEKASNTYSGGKSRNKLCLHVPKLKTKIDSATYLSFFTIVTKVMIYTSPQEKAFAEMVQAVSIVDNAKDLEFFVKKLEDIWIENFTLEKLFEALSAERLTTNSGLKLDTLIKMKQSRIFFSSVLLIKLINLNSNPEFTQGDDNCFMEWSISADQLDMELIQDDSSFMDLKVEQGSFTRLEMLDGSSQNQVVIGNIQILNNDYNILFPETLTAYKIPGFEVTSSNFMECSWQLGEKQNGMANIKNINIICSPMKICLEDLTGIKLIDFFFPPELKVGDEDSSDSELSTYEKEEDCTHFPLIGTKDDKVLYEKLSHSADQKMNHCIDQLEISGQKKKGEFNHLVKKESDSVSLISPNSLNRTRSGTSGTTNASKTIENTYSSKLNRQIIGGNHMDITSAIENLIELGISTNKTSNAVSAQNLIKESEKVKEYFVIEKMYMEDFILNITFSGKGYLRLMNVNNLSLKVPKYVVNEKLWTSLDIINSIKKHVIKTLLKQTGKLLTNKMFVYRKHKRVNKFKKRKTFKN